MQDFFHDHIELSSEWEAFCTKKALLDSKTGRTGLELKDSLAEVQNLRREHSEEYDALDQAYSRLMGYLENIVKDHYMLPTTLQIMMTIRRQEQLEHNRSHF